MARRNVREMRITPQTRAEFPDMPMRKYMKYDACNRIISALFLAGVCSGPSLVVSETVYKSVDADGNVTYASSPTEQSIKSKPITVPLGPTDEQRQEAEQIEKRLENAATQRRQDLAVARNQRTGSLQEAEQSLAEAKADLEETKIIQDSDWQFLGGGGRHLKESYLQRVQQAEERVRAAEQELASVRRDSR